MSIQPPWGFLAFSFLCPKQVTLSHLPTLLWFKDNLVFPHSQVTGSGSAYPSSHRLLQMRLRSAIFWNIWGWLLFSAHGTLKATRGAASAEFRCAECNPQSLQQRQWPGHLCFPRCSNGEKEYKSVLVGFSLALVCVNLDIHLLSFSICRVEIWLHVLLRLWEIMNQSMYISKDWYCPCIPLLTNGYKQTMMRGNKSFLEPNSRCCKAAISDADNYRDTLVWLCISDWTEINKFFHFFAWHFVLSHYYILSSDYSNNKKNVFDIFEIVVRWWISGKLLRWALIML